MSLPFVYIAGPYTHPDPVANSRRAVDVMHAMLDTGAVTPLCPHLSLFAEFARCRPVEEWYDYDKRLLARCDALYLLRGPSTGADAEVRYAEAKGIPVFPEQPGMDKLLEWANRWRPPAYAAALAEARALLAVFCDESEYSASKHQDAKQRGRALLAGNGGAA